MIKPGELALLKASEETVFVVSVDSTPSASELIPAATTFSGNTALVRRPIATEASGIQHVLERYLLEELETPEEKLQRNKRDYEAFKKVAASAANSAEPLEALPELLN